LFLWYKVYEQTTFAKAVCSSMNNEMVQGPCAHVGFMINVDFTDLLRGRPSFSALSQVYREYSFSQPPLSPLKVYKSSERNYDGGRFHEIKHADPSS
jgi:hypothetical protein